MPKILEVIVTSAEEAAEAEAGGADRLEVVQDLAAGGLTPARGTVEKVLKTVRIPVRVMLRENATMAAGDRQRLERDAHWLDELPLDGLVTGFLAGKAIDCPALAAVLSAAPHMRFTFHRAFDELSDPHAALDLLKKFPRIDRVLTGGGAGGWIERRERLLAWQRAGGSCLRVLVAAGLCADVHAGLRTVPELEEVHVGRAARLGRSIAGPVTREAVEAVKRSLP